jgi:hypothetical protein
MANVPKFAAFGPLETGFPESAAIVDPDAVAIPAPDPALNAFATHHLRNQASAPHRVT